MGSDFPRPGLITGDQVAAIRIFDGGQLQTFAEIETEKMNYKIGDRICYERLDNKLWRRLWYFLTLRAAPTVKENFIVEEVDESGVPIKVAREKIKISLTPRETDVARLVAIGKVRKEIADDLEISPRTVEIYLERLRQKFFVRHTSQLISNLSRMRQFS
jgi:DNA-binding CsgD family transcriptional regulator